MYTHCTVIGKKTILDVHTVLLLQRAELFGVEHTSKMKVMGIADETFNRSRGSERFSHTYLLL
jgi:hypothetical protein